MPNGQFPVNTSQSPSYQFEFRPIARKFTRSLITNHGVWDVREAIILRLRDASGNCGWGEIAPISWFGSETLAQAWDFCRQLPQEITTATIFSIPDHLPACQFAFESALEGLGTGNFFSACVAYSALLPAGEAALNQWQTLWEQGYRTFKWKIGVDDITQELQIFDLLTQALPADVNLRLDANGGLNYKEAQIWLETGDQLRNRPELAVNIEFIEQPLPIADFSGMLDLNHRYHTAIALDESVATLQQLATCYEEGWRGIFVIKPAIAGSPSRLRQFCQQHEIDAVFSSVFETAIARQAALRLAGELSHHNRAVGFGINHFFIPVEDETWPESLFSSTDSAPIIN